jgi:hypothetical protein
MTEFIGWLATLLVLLGFVVNARGKYLAAMIIWIVGDLTWIAYDLLRSIQPHLFLSLAIIGINCYGIYNLRKRSYSWIY